MHVYYIDHEYWESMSAETMTFTTRETVECDEGSLSGRFHIRGDENPPWNATQIEWGAKEGKRDGTYSLHGSELDT